MVERKFYERISAASVKPPGDASQDWLVNAERDGIRLLTREENDFVILYASFQALLIIAVFGEASRREMSRSLLKFEPWSLLDNHDIRDGSWQQA